MRAHLRTAIVVVLAVAMLAWFLKGANLSDVWAEIARARLEYLALALGSIVLTYLLRGLRWQYLLLPLGRPHFPIVFKTTVIGFAASTLLPARAGEVIRPYLLARREGFNATAAFATVIVERLLDLLTVLLLFAAYLLLAGPAGSTASSDVIRALKMGGLVAGAASIMGLAVMMVAAGNPEGFSRWALRIEHVLPATVAHAVANLVKTFLEGLAVVRQPQRLAISGLLSIPLWLSIALGIWAVSQAYHIEMSYLGSFAMMAVLVVGVAVPTPGAVGGFHQAYRIGATAIFGAANDRAVGAAIVLHAISFVPVTIFGAVFMAQEGLSLSRVQGIAADATREEAP
jgi:glycosyltransferase 2 family protein